MSLGQARFENSLCLDRTPVAPAAALAYPRPLAAAPSPAQVDKKAYMRGVRRSFVEVSDFIVFTPDGEVVETAPLAEFFSSLREDRTPRFRSLSDDRAAA